MIHFSFYSCACQKGKGVCFAMKRMERHLREHHKEYANKGYVVKLDIHHFFESIPHTELHRLVDEKVSNPHYRHLMHEVIDSFAGNIGIGLGSQMCQLLANAYLNSYDHMMKEKVKCRHYIRYSDDIVMFFDTKERAQEAMRISKEFLNTRKLELNEKSCIHPIRQGVKFLKFHFIFRHDRMLKPASKAAVRRYIRHFRKLMGEPRVPKTHLEASLEAWASRMKQGDNGKIIYEVYRRFQPCVK